MHLLQPKPARHGGLDEARLKEQRSHIVDDRNPASPCKTDNDIRTILPEFLYLWYMGSI